MSMLQFSDKSARRLEAIYRSQDMVAQRRATMQLLAPLPGEAIIDIGCGPGFLSLDLAAAVAPTGRVLGIDISEDLLRAASHQKADGRIAFCVGDAARLDVPDATFDAAVCVQVLEYVADVDLALREMIRVLRPGGRVLIVDTDWDGVVWHSADRCRMATVLAAWSTHCPHPHLPRTLAPALSAAGFTAVAVAGHPIIDTQGDEDSYSLGLLNLIMDFVAKQGAVSPNELSGWAAEQLSLATQGHYFFSSLRCLFSGTKPEAP